MINNTYLLYEHLTPNHKRYFGITGQNPEKRWQNGYGYKTQMFYLAIQKYGWENIEHKIIHTNLTLDEANFYEKYYINKYKTYDSRFGYNCTMGGDGVISPHTNLIVQKLNGKVVNVYLNSVECAKKINVSPHIIRRYCKDGNEHGGYLFEEVKNYKTNAYFENFIGFNEEYFDVKDKIEIEKRSVISSKLKLNKCRKIHKYDLDGNYICTYPSKKIAEKECAITIRMNNKRNGKYIFSYSKLEHICKYENPLNRRIIQMDKNTGSIIKEYESIKKASEITNIGFKNISKVLRGTNKTAGGYIWRYQDEYLKKIG